MKGKPVASVESAVACLRNVQDAMANEFELDRKTNLYVKQLPAWAAEVRDLIHSAHDHLLNALDATPKVGIIICCSGGLVNAVYCTIENAGVDIHDDDELHDSDFEGDPDATREKWREEEQDLYEVY